MAEFSEWQPSVDAWVKENYKDDDKYFPPQMVSKLEFDDDEVKNDDEVNVAIVGINDGDSVPLEFRLNVEVSAANDIDVVNIYMDGNKVAEDKSEPFGYNFELKASDIGEHTFEASAKDDNGNKGNAKVKLKVAGY